MITSTVTDPDTTLITLMLDLKSISLRLSSVTGWLSWTKDLFLRWTLQPTSSHSADSSTECVGKRGWFRPSFRETGLLVCRCGTFLVWLPERHSSGPFWASWQLKTFSSWGHCQWTLRATAGVVPDSCPNTETRRSKSWEDIVNLVLWTSKKKGKKELQWILQSSDFKYCIETSGVSLFHGRIKSHAGMKEYHKS